MSPFKRWAQRVREYDRVARIGEIGRRYFAMNAFDGVLTIIGVLMGNLTAQVEEPTIVVSTGLSTCVAMGVSGLWGAYLTESAERKRDLQELGRYTLTDLGDTRIGRASRAAVIIVAVIDSLAPFLSAVIVLIPFFFAGLLPAVDWAYYGSLGMALLSLLGLGVFLGHISRGNVVLFGLRTIVAGVVSILISLALGA